jgi:hypothetical protein
MTWHAMNTILVPYFTFSNMPTPPKLKEVLQNLEASPGNGGRARRSSSVVSPPVPWGDKFQNSPLQPWNLGEEDDSYCNSSTSSGEEAHAAFLEAAQEQDNENESGVPTEIFGTPPLKKKRKISYARHPTNVIVDYAQLASLLGQLRCPCGSSDTEIERRTIGIATRVFYCCMECHNSISLEPDTVTITAPADTVDKDYSARKITSYCLNIAVVTALQNIGRSSKAATTICGCLGVSSTAFAHKWVEVEALIGKSELKITDEILKENRAKETGGQILPPNGKYPIECSGDMGWLGKLSSRDAMAGFGHLIGHRSKLPL